MAYNYMNYRAYSVRFDETDRTLSIIHEDFGTVLSGITFAVHTKDLNHVYEKITPESFGYVECAHEKHFDSKGLSVAFCGGHECLTHLTLRVLIDIHGVTCTVESEKDNDWCYDISGVSEFGADQLNDVFAVHSDYKGKAFLNSIGPAASRGCDSLFDRKNDALLRMTSGPMISFDYATGKYNFVIRMTDDLSFHTSVIKNYMSEKYGIHWKGMSNNTVFKRPPVGWMTWYAVQFKACEEAVLENSAVQREKLKAYGADAVWVDWEWYHDASPDERPFRNCDTFHPDPEKYPNGLKYVADKIREDGFRPCVWIGASHDTRESDYIRENPETVLIQRRSWCGDWWFDPTHPKYLNEFIPNVFNMLKNEWGYDAIKWDALPRALDYYDQYHDKFYDTSLSSEQAMRNVVKKAREIVGDETYMLSCHGEGMYDVLQYADYFDAARVGADIFSWDNFLVSGVQRLMEFYPFHNTLQYGDPDNLVIREEFNTMDQAITRASLFSLLGTPITLGDDLRYLPDDRIEIIRRAIPPINAHPSILDMRKLPDDVLVVGTSVRTECQNFVIADVFNMRERPIEWQLDFADLELEPEKEYVVYDFWNKNFEGVIRHGMKVSLNPCQSKVLIIKEAAKTPFVLSTNRHIAGGAFDLISENYDAESRTLSGVSKTVAGENYTMAIYSPATRKAVYRTFAADSDKLEWSVQM